MNVIKATVINLMKNSRNSIFISENWKVLHYNVRVF